MIPLETFSLYVLLCVLAPLVGAFTISFIIIFERRFDSLQKETIKLNLEKELQFAQYHQLNQQIQPHFFFNTLNTMLSLARLDRKDDLITGLEVMSKFFKFKYTTNESLIPVQDELSYVQNYLDIQRLRFSERLSVDINVSNITNNALLPPFMLQTIVENAFKHAFEKYSGPVLLRIIIYESDGILHIQMWNTYHQEIFISGKDYTLEEGGYGLRNIENRLKLLFPQQVHSIEMIHTQNETLVEVLLPFITTYQEIV